MPKAEIKQNKNKQRAREIILKKFKLNSYFSQKSSNSDFIFLQINGSNDFDNIYVKNRCIVSSTVKIMLRD